MRGKFRQDYRSNTWKDMHVIEASDEPKGAIITYPPFVTKVRESRRGSIGTILSNRLDSRQPIALTDLCRPFSTSPYKILIPFWLAFELYSRFPILYLSYIHSDTLILSIPG